MKKINKIRRIKQVLIVTLLLFVFLSPSVTRFVKFPRKPDEPTVPWYNPNLADFLYEDSIDQTSYPFNAYNESYIMCNIQNTAYANFTFNNTMYNVSYGLNTIPIDFGVINESYSIGISQYDIDREIFDWIIVEPLFIKEGVIEVNSTSTNDIEFDAGGPITILLQPDFSYNYLYLECLELSSKQIVLKNVFDPSQGYPDIDSQAYSSLVEDGRYISFDLNLKPGTHLMKVSGDGLINYKIVVNLDWDNDLLSDVDEIQKNAYYDIDPTIPNIWGFFEKGDSMLTNFHDGICNGEFSFYVPDSLKEPKFLYIDMFRGDFSEFNINGDSMTLKDMEFSTDYLLSREKSQFYGEISTGWNDIQYKFNSDKTSIILFRLNSETIPVIDYQELLDTDGDNLKDYIEEKSGLDPYKSDTDDDGIPDNYDGSPLSYLVLDKSKMCQIVVPHNESRNTVINLMIQKPFPDYSTYSTPRLWMNTYNVSIYLVMRLFGNSTIIRDDLVSIWKGDSSNVESYSLIDDYNCSGVGDAIPSSYNPESEFTFITGNPSDKTFDFEIIFPKGHSAKNDSALDIRFDFTWLVSYYNETSGESEILHYYDIVEDIIVQSITRRETDNVTYTLASPDSMVEHQIIWNLAQNSELGSFSDYNVDDDIVGSGFIDYLEMPNQMIEDRENNPILRFYNATYGFEDEAVGTSGTDIDFIDWASIDTGCSLDINYEIGNNRKILDFYDPGNGGVSGANYIADKVSGTIEFWWRTDDATDPFHIFLYDYTSITAAVYIFDDEFQYWDGVAWQQASITPEDNKWYHHKIVFDCTSDTFDWYIDGVLEAHDIDFTQNGDAVDAMLMGTSVQTSDAHTYIDAIGFSWDDNYNIGDNTVPICLENEVLYVTGLQSNFDILNKINIIENIPDPSFEVKFSGEYEALFSFCSISNDVSGLSNIFNQESKTCYLVSWHNYTHNGIEDYQQRVKVQDYPISLKLLNFTDAYVLEISTAFGNEIPINQIPTSINDPLHEKILLKNQTLIENKDEEFVVPTIVFVEDKDEIKIIRDYRSDDVILADLFFTEDPISSAIKLDKLFKLFGKALSTVKDSLVDTLNMVLVEEYVASFSEQMSVITPRYWNAKKYQALITALNHFLNEEDWTDAHIILQYWYKYEFLKDDLKISDQFRDQLKEMEEGLKDILVDIKKNFPVKLFKIALSASIGLSFITFCYNLYNVWDTILYWSEGDLKENIRRILTASLGVAISAISIYSIINIWDSFNNLLSTPNPLRQFSQLDSLGASMKYSAKIIKYLGWGIAIANAFFDIWQAIEIWDEDWRLALHLIIKTILINFFLVIGMDILLGYLATAGILGAKATFGLSLLFTFLAFLLSWLPYPRPSFEIMEQGSKVVLPMDNIKRHGSLEIGDDITIQLQLKNTGDWNAPLLHFHLRDRLKDSNSMWVSDWSDWQYVTHVPSTSWCYFVFERELDVPIINLTSQIDFFVQSWTSTDGARTIYDKVEEIYFSMPVLENNIASFFGNTLPLEEQINLESLDLMLKLAMENYQWKDANDILNLIQEIDPEYGGNIEIPVNANLGTNLEENIVEMDTVTDMAQFDFNIILEGTDYPIVNYTIITAEGFSTTSTKISQALNLNVEFSITANDPYPLAGIYYFEIIVTPSDNDTLIYRERIPFRIPIVEDFQITQSNIIFEETDFNEVYLAPYDFHDDTIQENPVGWTVNEEFGCTVDVIEGYTDYNGQYHDKVVELDWSGSQEHYEACWMETTISEVGIPDMSFEFWACVDYDIEYGWTTLFRAENEYGDQRVGVVVQGDYFNTTHNEVWMYPAGDYWEDPVIWEGMKIDEWYHFSLHYIADVNCTFTIRDSNGEIVLDEWRSVSPYQYNNDVFTINCGGDSGGEAYNVYIDALGHTNDSLYAIGDNLYPTDISSDVYQSSTQLEKGDVVFIEYRTTSYDEKLMTFLNNDVIQATYTVAPQGNQNHDYQYQEIIIDDTFYFDEIKFSEIYGRGYNRFEVKQLSIIDAGISVSQQFNPMNFSNDGNIPEFVIFDFSGVPFENIDQSLYPDEFHRESQITVFLPGSERNSEFNIILPEEPISNILWRGITYSKCGIGENNLYIDNLEFDGIHIVSPENMTHNIIGKSISSGEDEFNLEIIPEEDLGWKAYSLNGNPNVTFSGNNVNISLPESNGIYTIQVFGNNSLGTIFESAIRYFTIEYPISIRGMPNGASLHNTNNVLNVSIHDFHGITELTYSFQGNPEESVVNNRITIPYIPFGEYELEVFGKDSYGDTYSSGLIQFTIPLDTHSPSVADNFTFTNGGIIEPFGDLAYIDGNVTNIRYDYSQSGAGSAEIKPDEDILTEWTNPSSGDHYDDINDKTKGTGDYISPTYDDNMEEEEFKCDSFTLPEGHHVYRVDVWVNRFWMGSGGARAKISWDDGDTWSSLEYWDDYVELGFADDFRYTWDNLHMNQTQLNQFAVGLQAVGIIGGPPPGGIIVYCVWVEIFHQQEDSDLDLTIDLQVDNEDIYQVEYLKYSHKTNVSSSVKLDIWDWDANQWDTVETVDNTATFDDKQVVLTNASDYVNSTNGVKIKYSSSQAETCQLEIDMLKLWYSTTIIPDNLYVTPSQPDDFTISDGTLETPYGDLNDIDNDYSIITAYENVGVSDWSDTFSPDSSITSQWGGLTPHYQQVDEDPDSPDGKNLVTGISGKIEEFSMENCEIAEGGTVTQVKIRANVFIAGISYPVVAIYFDGAWRSWKGTSAGAKDYIWTGLSGDQDDVNNLKVKFQSICAGPPWIYPKLNSLKAFEAQVYVNRP
ncbi:MAG: hypothetical protein ACXAD7_15260, partial [Candidatus Kariarchaeaceae archaeon]